MNCVLAYFDDKLGPRIVFSSIPDDYNNFNLAYCLLPPGCHFCTEDSFFTSYQHNFYYAQLFQIPSDAQRPLRTYSVSISSPIFEKVLHFSVKVWRSQIIMIEKLLVQQFNVCLFTIYLLIKKFIFLIYILLSDFQYKILQGEVEDISNQRLLSDGQSTQCIENILNVQALLIKNLEANQ
ncbi:Hypothetical_protein [Hexamita inflata]|uniref:Hypothetical_protein n=1 Tax=Hexamita inflata TaxID=28002 RepID=A0AA86UI53_9EUKA|nr:Hypothetical protein HINF_LOCUS39752 [Hexamita inflata]